LCASPPRTLPGPRASARPSRTGAQLLLGLLCVCCLASGCGGDLAAPTRASGLSGGRPGATILEALRSTGRAPFRFFASSSFWNEPVPADAPLDPTSSEVVAAFSAQIAGEQRPGHWPWINTTSSSVPVYVVGADQPTVRVKLATTATAPALQAAWKAVPLPPTAQPAAGGEKVLVVWQPSTDRLWEFWRMEHRADGWHAMWGGAMRRVSADAGVYGPTVWPGAKPGWGDSASSLALTGGLISLEDLDLGQINHALAIAIPNVRAGVYASPAQRSDGRSSDPLALPEGAHLRLDPNLDLAALHLPPSTLMIAQAAQRYGLFVRDYSPNVAFYAQAPPAGTDPYAGLEGYFEGRYPREILASFPWSHLQLLQMQLHPQSARKPSATQPQQPATGGAQAPQR
jgi:hypothetical protein